ncbi:uncharacterized protein LOC117970563 [Acipenser ruthenus]|uniref:uncharacterized protein LOC117970563 n=1 Tax=Acipenser ruthenus TaxID=7906 RepID=UPI001560526B|nr:uncharacterized protein LOC117970563 [Acipenser ruthenus]
MDPSLRTIGQGYFGKVYRTKYKGKIAALKKIPESTLRQSHLQRELEIYQKLNHVNIVKLLGAPWKEHDVWLFPLEFIEGEELETVIFNPRGSKIQLTNLVKATIITGMCRALNCLHEENIVHQDLKPDNIMIENYTFRPVLIDFGLAKLVTTGGFSTATNNGNRAYAAPEIQHGGVRNKPSDVWAMGKIITDLLLQKRVDPLKCGCRHVEEILKGMPYARSVSRMVYTNPQLRVEIKKILAEIEMAGEAFKSLGGMSRRGGFGINAGQVEKVPVERVAKLKEFSPRP